MEKRRQDLGERDKRLQEYRSQQQRERAYLALEKRASKERMIEQARE